MLTQVYGNLLLLPLVCVVTSQYFTFTQYFTIYKQLYPMQCLQMELLYKTDLEFVL